MTVPKKARDKGWAAIPNWIARDGSISPAAKAVYIALSSRLDASGWCFPSQATLSRETGYGVTRIKEATKELVDLGVLKVVMETTERGRRNRYRISISTGG